MSLEERIQAAAEQERERKRADIERLLAANVGKLLRASELSEPMTEKPGDLADLIPNARRIPVADGVVLVVENRVAVHEESRHPRGYAFTPSPTRPLTCGEAFSSMLVRLSSDESFAGVELEKLAFFDLETTGLAGASGTYPILVGLGYFARDEGGALEFVCEQYFMEDYCHEPALLTYMRERLEQFDAFVTYNGKTFDIPLIRGRCIVNRLRVDLERPHLDLLHPARRIYKGRIGACNLGSVEREVLRVSREHDIDGSLIPQIYFDFLRGKRPERLVPVFDHNVQDIVSLGALLLLLLECMDDPEHPALAEAHDIAGIGRTWRRSGNDERAVEFLERASLLSRDEDVTNTTLRDLARIYRKTGRFDEAVSIWRQECERTRFVNIEAVVELAKILEHNLKDHAGALEVARRAEAVVTQRLVELNPNALMTRIQQEALLADLSRRCERLQKRIARLQASAKA